MSLSISLALHRWIMIGIAGILSLTLAACGDSDDDEDAADSSAYDGTWETSCIADDDNFQKTKLTIAGTAVTSLSTTYSDSSCSTTRATVAIKVTMTVEGDSDVVAGAKNIALAISSLTFNSVADTTEACGKSSDPGEDLVLKKADCEDDDDYSHLFDTGYDLIEIVSSRLYFGKNTSENDGTTKAKRPTSLEDESDSFGKI